MVTMEEFSEQQVHTENPGRDETGHPSIEKGNQAIYAGEVELAIAAPVDLKMVSKLYDSLQTIPELMIRNTRGSLTQGAIITVVLGKPMPLIEMISSKLSGVEMTPELPPVGGLGKENSSPKEVVGKAAVKRIKLASKGA